jgi:hypothetical protein
MSDTEKLAVFPDIVPTSAIMTRLWVYENGDFHDDESVSNLLTCLYDYPEDEFYLYTLKSEQISNPIRVAINNEVITIAESKGHYYKHPNFKRDYLCIIEGINQCDWESKVLAQGNMHYQRSLKLTEKARRRFEMQEMIAMQKAANSNPIVLEPNFMGIGIDLKKAPIWLLQQFRKIGRHFISR